jgi:hypothetical protein
MTEHQSSRTLVKSSPELWAECSDAASLARHLGAFGEIHITKLEPETAVAWEGAAASGTVRLEPSGWGTRVTLTVTEEAVAPAQEPEVAVDPEPKAVEPVAVEPEPEAREPVAIEPEPEPAAVAEPAPRPSMFARLRLSFRRRPGPEPEVLAVEPEPEVAEPEVAEPEVTEPEAAQPEPEPVAEAPPAPADPGGEAALVAALDSLGMAHHRPYSRA